MMMKKLKAMILATAGCLLMSVAQAQSVRESIRLDKGWKFKLGHAADPQKDFGCGTEYFNYLTKANSIHNEGPYAQKFDDAGWEEVQVPHDWVATLPYAPEASHSHGYKTVGWKYPETSVGWYRKNVRIEKSNNVNNDGVPCSYYLRFDGIFRNAQVWFNGFYMGTEPSGYATQMYDITPYIKYGEDNLICVRADASLEEGWFYEGGGIYRDVWLEKKALVSVAPFGTFVYVKMQKPYTLAEMTVETEVKNDGLEVSQCEVAQRLLDAEGKEVAKTTPKSLLLKAKETVSCKQQFIVREPHLWSPADPYLYQVETTITQQGKVTDCYLTTKKASC